MKLRITIAGNTYEAEVEVLEEEGPPRHDAAATPYVPPPTSADPNAQELEDTVRRSPVTGLVIRVAVELGQAVEANQLLIVLESMKMETQVTAPRAGLVDKIHVAAGNSVRANQPLIELEWQVPPAGESQI